MADIAVRHNTVARPAPTARRALRPAVARALVPGGTLLLQPPPDRLPSGEGVQAFLEQRVGHHVYEGQMVMPAGPGRIRTRFDYRVREAGGVVREHTETFWMWPASRDEPADDLAEHGFVPLPGRAEPTVPAMSIGPMEEYRAHKE